ncbi:MAG: DUF503 domain-containing protein [Candidatus Omnitrophica bacterium]|nr:DUF503 domain-containing protein [Candidatus Omnitrophota bacterium]
MTIGILEISIKIDASHSLKDKRMVLKSLKDRVRNNFNVAVSEIGAQDNWQISRLCIVSVNSDKRCLNSLLCKILEFVHHISGIEVNDYHLEFI